MLYNFSMGKKRGKYNVKLSMTDAAKWKRAQRGVKAASGKIRHHPTNGNKVKVVSRKEHGATHRRRKDGSAGGRPRTRRR